MIPPRQRSGWRWALYRVVTGPRWPGVRLLIWIAQIPIVALRPTLADKIMYVVQLSIAAGIESAMTDWVEAWKFVEEEG